MMRIYERITMIFGILDCLGYGEKRDYVATHLLKPNDTRSTSGIYFELRLFPRNANWTMPQ